MTDIVAGARRALEALERVQDAYIRTGNRPPPLDPCDVGAVEMLERAARGEWVEPRALSLTIELAARYCDMLADWTDAVTRPPH
jgi:hypothetical protein